MSEDEQTRLELLKAGPQGLKKSPKKPRKSRINTPEPTKAKIRADIQFSDEDDNRAVEDVKDIIFKPNEGPQTDFLAAGEREVLFGGAAGGDSKS